MRRRIICWALALASTVVVVLVSAAPASASTRVEYSPTYTFGSDYLCGATVNAAAVTHPAAPGKVWVGLEATFHTPLHPPLHWRCDFRVHVNWRNIKSGKTGSQFIRLLLDQAGTRLETCGKTLPGPGGEETICGRSGSVELSTGPGWITSWVTTSSTAPGAPYLPHIPGSARINAF